MASREKPILAFVVDDEPDILKLIHHCLLPRGFQTELFESGNEVLKRLKKKPAPDIILLDVMMPAMDGWSACRAIREIKATKKVPVVFLTAKNQGRDYMEGLQAGGNLFIEKPFDVDRLPATLRKILDATGRG